MTKKDPEILSDEEAARLWGRAAQLQAEDAGRIEAPEVQDARMPPPGYALANVRSAALEAGIAEEYMDAALAELRAERRLPESAQGNALARRFLNHPPSTLTARRVIDATPVDVLAAMEAVFPNDPYRLTLTDQQGDPMDQGVLIFDIHAVNPLLFQGFGFDTREAGLRQVFVTLRPIGGSASCEMTVQSPVTSQNLGLGVGLVLSVLAGGVGAMAFAAIGFATGLGPLTAIVGAVLGGGLGVKGYRALYAYAMRRGRKALEGLVGAVAVRTKGVWRGLKGGAEPGAG